MLKLSHRARTGIGPRHGLYAASQDQNPGIRFHVPPRKGRAYCKGVPALSLSFHVCGMGVINLPSWGCSEDSREVRGRLAGTCAGALNDQEPWNPPTHTAVFFPTSRAAEGSSKPPAMSRPPLALIAMPPLGPETSCDGCWRRACRARQRGAEPSGGAWELGGEEAEACLLLLLSSVTLRKPFASRSHVSLSAKRGPAYCMDGRQEKASGMVGLSRWLLPWRLMEGGRVMGRGAGQGLSGTGAGLGRSPPRGCSGRACLCAA